MLMVWEFRMFHGLCNALWESEPANAAHQQPERLPEEGAFKQSLLRRNPLHDRAGSPMDDESRSSRMLHLYNDAAVTQ
ncbi:hypothetical protein BAUCODRAFT_566002 [Baudoinia panamericana UAMH 10762]|uniref:Uncharacterized protein n=1 Tax=Baudoinia panamericana (strain UAMH 10762) TaxID=717646 RepID=M2LKT6_BAUPA|nr:uncharacterized protein BAUCODRAFT_566002 [Baudoinia panamericana UAMH 10762]EMC94897.1 hypothetical protein BAUCODRAFT_566002 [Baudoinia panamericana UAMH 10762]